MILKQTARRILPHDLHFRQRTTWHPRNRQPDSLDGFFFPHRNCRRLPADRTAFGFPVGFQKVENSRPRLMQLRSFRGFAESGAEQQRQDNQIDKRIPAVFPMRLKLRLFRRQRLSNASRFQSENLLLRFSGVTYHCRRNFQAGKNKKQREKKARFSPRKKQYSDSVKYLFGLCEPAQIKRAGTPSVLDW